MESGRGGRGGGVARANSWVCPNPNCQANCYGAGRTECVQCGAPRPGADGVGYSMDGKGNFEDFESSFHEKMMASQNNEFDNEKMGQTKMDMNFSSNKGPSGWESYQQPEQGHNAFTPIWSGAKEPEASTSRLSYNSGYVGRDEMIDRNNPFGNNSTAITPGMKAVQEKVTNSTTPMANLPYIDQVSKKMKETRWMAQELATQLVTVNPQCKAWVEQKVQQFGHIAKVDKCVESPLKEGYRNKCEFAIGVNPDSRRLTVGFKLDPRSGSSEVGPVDHLLHVPSGMKQVVKLLENFLRAQPYHHFDLQRSEGQWVSAVVRTTRPNSMGRSQIMVVLSFCPQHLNPNDVKTVKTKLRGYFERGEGSQCGITSLYFSEKGVQGQGSLELLLGEETVTETLLGNLQFLISPRAYFCINTAGAEVLVEAIASMVGMHKNMTLLDICCGTGTLGMCLANRVGQVLGVDILPSAIDEAQRNAKNNRLSNCSFMVGNAEDAIGRMIQGASNEEVVAVIDPPRQGLPEKSMRMLRATRIKKIVFVSSDPKATLKNLVDLGRPASTTFFGEPFMPALVQPVDLFPHTTHYMTLVQLIRIPQAELQRAGTPAPQPNLFPAYGTNTYSTAASPAKQNTPAPSYTSTQATSASYQGRQVAAQANAWMGQQPSSFVSQETAMEEEDLTQEQLSWLGKMVEQHGNTFARADWVAKFRADNQAAMMNPATSAKTAAVQARPPAHQPAQTARPPSPEIPPMPPFPVAPSTKDPREYAKYKMDYDNYSEWYNKWGEAYAAKEEKKKQKQQSSGATREMPDPNKVPAGTDPAAWRKYCQDTVEYWEKYDKMMAQQQ